MSTYAAVLTEEKTRIVNNTVRTSNYKWAWPKKLAHFVLYALTLSNIDQFSNLFHSLNQENICNNTVTKDLTTPQGCRYTTLWNISVL